MMIVQINFSVKLLINFAAYFVDHADSLSLSLSLSVLTAIFQVNLG